jgi:hypothetical protein
MTRPHLDPPPDDPLRDVWANAQPQLPGEAEWQVVGDGIAARLTAARRVRTVRRWAVAGLVSGLAAAVTIAALVWPRATPTPPAVEMATDPLAEYDVLPIATESDVMVSAVRSNGIGLVACDHPLPGVMPLATSDDISVARVEAGGMSVPTPADAPLFVEGLDK